MVLQLQQWASVPIIFQYWEEKTGKGDNSRTGVRDGERKLDSGFGIKKIIDDKKLTAG
jgi:hypothetical protein